MSGQLIFGRYEIIRRVAVGGMGEIFLARERSVVDRLVVLKALLPELAFDEANITAFLDEARVAAMLNHPNVVSLYEVGHWNGAFFIAMEYIEGESLNRIDYAAHKAGIAPSWRVIAQIIHDAALGLDYAHRAADPQGQPLNIIHRDISPQNIMVRMDGVTKVVDFGIAKAANRAAQSTKTGVLKGKIAYMTPELLCGEPQDARSDQFALGVVLWELCARRRRVEETDNSLRAIKLASEPVGPLPPETPPALGAICERMVRQEMSERYPSLRDVCTELDRFLSETGSSSAKSDVSAFVESMSGEEVSKRTSDLTPREENFYIRLTPDPNTETGHSELAPTRRLASLSGEQVPPTGRKGTIWIAVAVLLGVALVGSVLYTQQREPPKPVVATPAPEITVVDVSVTSMPEGAAVNLGDVLLGITPLEAKLNPGAKHELTFHKKGYKMARLEVVLDPDQPTAQVSATMEKAPIEPVIVKRPAPVRRPAKQPRVPPPRDAKPTPAKLSLISFPPTQVYIDGKPVGWTPVHKKPLPPGEHTLRLVSNDGSIDEKKKIVLEPGKVEKLRFDFTKK